MVLKITTVDLEAGLNLKGNCVGNNMPYVSMRPKLYSSNQLSQSAPNQITECAHITQSISYIT